MLAATSQVLVRNQDVFSDGHWLLCNPADPFIFRELNTASLFGFHQYFDQYQQASDLTDSRYHYFGAEYKSKVPLDGAVIYMPKSKEHARMLISNIASCIKPGGQLLLVGENKAGIKSGAKLLEPFSEQVNKIDSARHCSLFCAQLSKGTPPFDLKKWQTRWAMTLSGTELEIVSLPGVFSHKELDEGTKLLLENVKRVPAGKVLDFACGAGVIGCFLAKKQSDMDLVMSDVSALALHCAAESAKANGIQCDIIASDGLTDVPGNFEAVFTNPPFHTGIQTNYAVTEKFIQDLKRHLRPGGSVLLVANRFLKYPQALQENLNKVKVVAKTTKFTLYSGIA